MKKKTVINQADNTELAVFEKGSETGRPVIFLHGMFQCSFCWYKQFENPSLNKYRLIALDLRGHGKSDKPKDNSYQDAALWAQDINSCIESLGLEKPVIAAWSYGAYVLFDYLKSYGDSGLGGIVFAGAAYILTEDFRNIGRGLRSSAGMLVSDKYEDRKKGTGILLDHISSKTIPDDKYEEMMEYNLSVPLHARKSLVSRTLDYSGILERIEVPVLNVIGTKDRIILPVMGEEISQKLKNVTTSKYEGCGHMMFIEESERFNRELDKFASGLG